jgi:broad specificity phosphatase PhoE
MNHLQHVTNLKNRYFAMRHGQSKANLQNIIISHPKNGTHEDYALSDLGRKQALESAKKFNLPDDTIIYTSDFSRAVETAEIVQKELKAPEIHITKALRERHFGDWEKTDSVNYHMVWAVDESNADHNEGNVEPVNSVLDRATSLIIELEQKYTNKDILLVSHGDTLQILQTGFQKVPPTMHRSLKHLETAEIRPMSLA